jgi:uncharacterized membrane protein
MVNPFDPNALLLAKHAQHVVLVHFPIGLFIAGVGLDFAGQWTKKPTMEMVARYNLLIAAVATVPVIATGLLAWQWQLGGHQPKGILLQHLILGIASSCSIWVAWWIHFRAHRTPGNHLPGYRLPIELAAATLVALTAHLGGFLSGVNGPV